MGIFVCYFFSGFSALLYEIAFARVLVRILGATTPAITSILSFYLLGLACGAILFGMIADRTQKPLKLYAWLELGAAIGGAIFPLISSIDCNRWLLGGLSVTEVNVAQYIYAALIVLFPTVFIGGTFPVLSKFLGCGLDISAKANVVLLYAVNLIGATTGIVCGALFFIPQLGLSKTVWLGACINILIFALAMIIAQKNSSNCIEPDKTENRQSTSLRLPLACSLVFLSGAVSLGLEIVFTRFSSLILGSSVYAITAVVAMFLLSMGAGSLIVFVAKKAIKDGLMAVGFASFVGALALWCELLLANKLPAIFAYFQNGPFLGPEVILRVVIAAGICIVPAMAIGAIFPLVILSYRLHISKIGNEIAILSFVSTVGSIVGSWLTGFCLIPWLGSVSVSGMQSTVRIFCALLLTVAFVSLMFAETKKWKLSGVVVLAICLGIVVCFIPNWNQSRMSHGISLLRQDNDHLVKFYREGATSTVTVGTEPSFNLDYLESDGRVQAAVPVDFNKPALTSDLNTQLLLGLLPYLCNPNEIKNVLLIGYGSGTTCGALTALKNVPNITVAEIEPVIYEASKYFSQLPEAGEKPILQLARVHAHVGDARNFLYASDKSEQFDAIISQPSEPWISVASDLYTYEFMRLVRSRLSENGVYCQWVQLYGITPEYLRVFLRTFHKAFPVSFIYHSRRAGEILMVGVNSDDKQYAIKTVISERLNDPIVKPLLKRIGLTPAECLDSFIATPKDIERICQYGSSSKNLVNTDDNLLFEYALPKELYRESSLIGKNLAILGLSRDSQY